MKKIFDDWKKILESGVWWKTLYAVGIVLAVILIFAFGVSVGFHEASFGQEWSEHYTENFGGKGVLSGRPGNILNPHGAAGEIVKVELPNIIVASNNHTEKSIFISDKTLIQKGNATIQSVDLKTDDFVVVIGAPDKSGVINAKFIRLIPEPDFLQ